MRQVVVGSAEIELARPIDIGAPTIGTDFRPVVTRLQVHRGNEVHAGDVLAAVADRPVIVLPGRIPAFRTVLPGDRGSDVGELQRAMSSIGFSSSPDPCDPWSIQPALRCAATDARIAPVKMSETRFARNGEAESSFGVARDAPFSRS